MSTITTPSTAMNIDFTSNSQKIRSPTAEIRAAMERKSKEFRESGSELYIPKLAAE